jgi:hypothetical protein
VESGTTVIGLKDTQEEWDLVSNKDSAVEVNLGFMIILMCALITMV